MMHLRMLLAALLSSLSMRAEAAALGAVKLDNLTLDKMVAVPGLLVLVKFDKSYAYGHKENAFKELCKLASRVDSFVVAEIPVQEYGEKENQDVALRFDVKPGSFPAYFLFKGSVDSPAKFEGIPDSSARKPSDWDGDEDGVWEAPILADPTTENLIEWLRSNGVSMPSVGRLHSLSGVVRELGEAGSGADLDQLAKSFLTGGLNDSDLQAARAIAENARKNKTRASIYVKVMEKVKAKGTDYIYAELIRVQKLLENKLPPEKEREMRHKVKVLNMFAMHNTVETIGV